MESLQIKERPSFLYLIKTFLIIGASSFGGYSALVSVIQDRLVDRDKLISSELIIKGFSLASILPGPVAVNTVTYIGFNLRGWLGAMVCMLSVVFPSFILMIVLTHFYLKFGTIPEVSTIMLGIVPVVMGIILTAGYNMSLKNIKNWRHILILALSLFVQVYFDGYFFYLLTFVIGGVLGYLFFYKMIKRKENESAITGTSLNGSYWHIIFLVLVVCAIIFQNSELVNLKLFSVFSEVSLTLFGGGYVMIPMLHSIIVEKLNWLNSTEFMDAITLGQITPGPILISATFVGYKVGGIFGSAISTFSIFAPSAMLIILVADLFKKIDNNRHWLAIFEGLKPVVISFIISSLLILLEASSLLYFTIAVAIISAIMLIKYKVNYLYLILLFGTISLIFNG